MEAEPLGRGSNTEPGIGRPAGDDGGHRLMRELLDRVALDRMGGETGLHEHAVEPVARTRSPLAVDVAHARRGQVGEAANPEWVAGGKQ